MNTWIPPPELREAIQAASRGHWQRMEIVLMRARNGAHDQAVAATLQAVREEMQAWGQRGTDFLIVRENINTLLERARKRLG